MPPTLSSFHFLRPLLFGSLCALAANLSSAATRDPDAFFAGDRQWKRTPELLVPFAKNPPSIDGEVDLREWSGAAGLGPLKVGETGATDDLQRRVWIMYDDSAVYIAFRFERPKDTLSPLIPGEKGRFEKEADPLDTARAFFAPALNFEKVYDFWLYANGAFGDALCSRESDIKWDASWKQAARLTPWGWEGEMAIPFSTFGLSAPPPPDQWWGFDFVDYRGTPSRLSAHWSYRGRIWTNFENLGRIRFARGASLRPVRAGETSDGRYGVEFEVVNATDADQKLVIHTGVFARKPSDGGAEKSYFDNIESGVTQDAQAEFSKDATLSKMIDFAEGFYQETPAAPQRSEEIIIPAGQRRTFGLAGDLSVGEYLSEYQVLDGSGSVLGRGAMVFQHETPLALRIEPYWLYSEVIDVFADLSRAGLKGEGEIVYNVLPADGKGAPLKTSRLKIAPDSAEVKGSLDIKGVAPGFYQVEAVLLDGKGTEIARNALPVQRPEFPEWFRNDLGNKIEVPAPWTPVQADKKGQVSIWGRQYDLSTVLPRSVLSQGQEVLAAPVTLRTETSSGPVSWKVAKLSLQSQSPGKAIYDVTLEGGGLRASGTMRVEFDGLIWYELSLAPISALVEIKSMTLDIPVKANFSELMGRHKFLSDPVLYPKTPEPELNGFPGLLEDTRLPFTPYLWIGNEKAGMGFLAEAPMDWSIDAPSRLLETKRPASGSPARILANIIQAPKSLDKPMRLEFGLQGTPIRATPKDRSILNIYQKNASFDTEQDYQNLARLGCKVVVYYYGWRGDSETEMGGTPERPVTQEVRDKLKRSVQLAHQYGMKVIMFTGWGINAVSPNWKKYSYEFARYPITNGGWGTFNTTAGFNGAYIDFMAWGHADLAKEYGVDGVLWDSAANIGADSNLRTGNAWIDDQGRVRPKYALLATRELYRRIYNIYKGEVRQDGIIYNHAGSLWPVNVFADMQNRGEGRPMRAPTLRESWTPFEEFRSEYSAEPFGTLYSGEINDWEKLPMRVSTHLAVTLLHGTYSKEYSLMAPKRFRSYDYEARPVIALWETFNWLPMDGSEQRHYYYQNAAGKYQAVKADPASLLSSAFVSGDKKRAIIVVSNLDTTPVPGARIDINPIALGMAKGSTITVQDGITLEPITVQDGKVTLDIDQQRYRILKVTIE